MRRSRRSKRPNILGGVILLLLPIALILVVFNFLPDHYLNRNWPLGITQKEVDSYNDALSFVKGRSSELPNADWKLQHVEVPDRPTLSDTVRSPRWSYADLSVADGRYRVKVRRTRTTEGGYILKTQKGEYIQGMRQVVLLPASVNSISDKYAQILAEELGVPAPTVSFVGMSLNDGPANVYLLEERVDDHFAERYIGNGAQVFEQCADPRWPDCMAPAIDDPDARTVIQQQMDVLLSGSHKVGTIMDMEATSGLLALLAATKGPMGIAEHRSYAFRWMDGRIVPIHRSTRDAYRSGRLSHGSLLSIASAVADLSDHENYRKCVEEIWRIKERFAEAREAFLPLLAKASSTSIGVATARAERIEEQMLDKLLSLEADKSPVTIATVKPHSRESLRPSTVQTDDIDLPSIGALAVKFGGWLEQDTLVLPRGKYYIEEDLIIPEGKGLKLLSGARLFISPGVSILCQAPFNVRATSLRPVFIRPLYPDSAWGTLAVNMEKGEKCFINGLFMSGGSQKVIGGHRHTAMLSFHNGNVHISNSGLRSCYGEDMVNIKNGRITLRKNSFENGHADLVDLDDVTGSVTDCVFSNPATDMNGDGLDLSESEVYVDGCTFANCRDKGLSVGEASQVLVMRSTFYADSIGVAAKDLSKAYLYDCRFRGNTIAMTAYRKKAWMGGAELTHIKSTFYTDGQDIRKDALSTIQEEETLDEEILNRFSRYGATLRRTRR